MALSEKHNSKLGSNGGTSPIFVFCVVVVVVVGRDARLVVVSFVCFCRFKGRPCGWEGGRCLLLARGGDDGDDAMVVMVMAVGSEGSWV